MRELNKLFESYFSCRRIEDRDELGWGMWAGEGQPEGEAYFVDTDVQLRKTLAVRLLQVAAAKPAAELDAHSFPFENEGISSLIDQGDHSLRRTFTDIQEHPEKWSSILAAEARGKIPGMIAAFDRTLAAKQESDQARIAAAPLYQPKVDQFIRDIKEGFVSQAVFHALAIKHGFVRENLSTTLPPGAPNAWGFNQVSPKDLLVEHIEIHHNHGEEYGRGLARGEDRYAIRALAEALPQHGDQVKDIDAVSAALLSAYVKLRKTNRHPDGIITSLDLEDTSTFRQAKNFTPTWAMKRKSPEEPGFIGQFKMEDGSELPVYRLFYDNPKHLAHTICLVNLSGIGEILRLFPGASPEEAVNLHGFIYCSIIDLNANAEERKRILTANPPWLRSHADKDRHLRMRVLMKIFQRTKFSFKKEAGLKISVASD